MKMALLDNRRKGSRRRSPRRKTNIEAISIGEEGDSGQEITVRYEPAVQRKEKSTFSWFEEITVEWSETFLSRN